MIFEAANENVTHTHSHCYCCWMLNTSQIH